MANVFVVMAPALSLAADPDAALVRLEQVGEAVGERPGPADALAADPAAARRLAHVVGASRFATDLLVSDPERIRVLAERAIHADDAGADMVRVVGRYAGRELSPRETGDAITAVADRVVQEAVDEAAPSLPLAVIGMGKLGARELSFASDLDVVFVYDGEGPEDQSRAVESSERVMQLVLEAGWEIDADLRPEGRNGPLARSLAGFLDYWERYAELWEAQALLRVRDVAGDERLGRLRGGGARPGVPARGHHDRRGRADPPHARAHRTRTRAAARGDEVPLQAGVRVAGRCPVHGGDLVAAPRRLGPRGADHAHA